MTTNEMFYSLKLFKLQDACNYFLIKFLRKAMFQDFKLFDKYFTKFLPNHDYGTRRFNFIYHKLDWK
jgi:hypothetical protein